MNAATKQRPERPRQHADVHAPLGTVLQEQDTRSLDLAQRLHRDVAGGLVACATMSEMIRHELKHGGGPDALTGMLSNLESALRQTIRIVRDLTGEQLPAVLKAFGLGCALEQLAESTAGTACPVTVSITGDEPVIPLSPRLSLHQILQKLIHRIHHHAAGSHIEVICVFSPTKAEILIEHDGRDIMNSKPVDDSTLAAIKGRISLLGARLLVTRGTAEGLRRVRLVVPLPVKSDASLTTTTTSAPP